MKILSLSMIVTGLLYAHTDGVPNDCNKPTEPYKPYSFISKHEVEMYNMELEMFKLDLEAYKGCLKEFIVEQNNSIKNHMNAKKSSIEELKRLQ